MTAPLALDLPEPVQAPGQRFRRLLSEAEKTSPNDPLPASILEDLPEEAQRLLGGEDAPEQKSGSGDLCDTLEQSLPHQGYALKDDPQRNVRFGGDLRSNTGSLSPYDIVRMAADLDGGIQQTTELHRCPDCQAVAPSGVTCMSVVRHPHPLTSNKIRYKKLPYRNLVTHYAQIRVLTPYPLSPFPYPPITHAF